MKKTSAIKTMILLIILCMHCAPILTVTDKVQGIYCVSGLNVTDNIEVMKGNNQSYINMMDNSVKTFLYFAFKNGAMIGMSVAITLFFKYMAESNCPHNHNLSYSPTVFI